MSTTIDGAAERSFWSNAGEEVSGLAGKYLTFTVANEMLAIGILRVNQIIPMQEISLIPRMPPFIRGVINLRGMIIPIIDLRKKLDMCCDADASSSCIVVIQQETEGGASLSGIVIDEVREVIEIQKEDIELPPAFGAGIDTAFITGIAKKEKTVIILIDIVKLLSPSENRTVTELSVPVTS